MLSDPQIKCVSRKGAPVRFSEPTPVKCAALSFGIERGGRGKQRRKEGRKRRAVV